MVLMDLLWSDPTTNDGVEGVQPSPRGPGLVTFGPDRVKEFCKVSSLCCLCCRGLVESCLSPCKALATAVLSVEGRLLMFRYLSLSSPRVTPSRQCASAMI